MWFEWEGLQLNSCSCLEYVWNVEAAAQFQMIFVSQQNRPQAIILISNGLVKQNVNASPDLNELNTVYMHVSSY